MKKYILAAAAALLALASCSREQIAVDNGSREVRFTSNIENTFTVKGLDPIAEGKTVRILAGAPISANTDAEVVSGGKLTPATPLKWKENQTASTTFVGLYPSNGETETTITNYNLVGEASAQDFEYHNNFLVALAKDVNPGATVNLEFKHPFVKMVMNIDNQLTGTPEVTEVTVSEVVLSANLILDAGTIVPAADKAAVKATKNATSGKFEVIIMPQDGAKPVLTVAVGTNTYTFKINTATSFVAGKTYTANLTLKDTTPVDGDPVSFGFTVTDWEEEATPLVATDVTEQWSVVGDVVGGWGNDLVMTEGTTPGVLEAVITYQENDEFKLRKAASWAVSAGLKAGVTYVGDSNWDGYLDATDNNIKLQAAGVYTITFNPTNWVFTATKTGD
ncbi:MAG: fimbrillin family protein [Bacteroidales bacterium]|nr:fimbrillin family protein [Bacteroidales bacterium]